MTALTVIGRYSEADWFGEVTVDGIVLRPEKAQAITRSSPDGFSWGYAGSGPYLLAVGILLHFGLTSVQALRMAYEFKRLVVAYFPRASFRAEVDIEGWLARNERPLLHVDYLDPLRLDRPEMP